MQTLYRGLDSAVLMSLPMVGIYMPLYDVLQSKFSVLGQFTPAAAGSVARALAVFAVAPLELVRCARFQGALRELRWGLITSNSPHAYSAGPWDGLQPVDCLLRLFVALQTTQEAVNRSQPVLSCWQHRGPCVVPSSAGGWAGNAGNRVSRITLFQLRTHA